MAIAMAIVTRRRQHSSKTRTGNHNRKMGHDQPRDSRQHNHGEYHPHSAQSFTNVDVRMMERGEGTNTTVPAMERGVGRGVDNGLDRGRVGVVDDDRGMLV